MLSTLQEVIFLGYSAGGMGVQVWSDELINTIHAAAHAVVIDSSLLALVDLVEGYFFLQADFCNSTLIPTELVSECGYNSLTAFSIVDFHIRNHPEVLFIHIQAKYDTAQRYWYNESVSQLAGGSTEDQVDHIGYYSESVKRMHKFNSNGNWLVYIVEDDPHGFVNFQHVFTTTADGSAAYQGGAVVTTVTGEPVNLFDFLTRLPYTSDTASISSVCSGDCSKTLFPKSFLKTEEVLMYKRYVNVSTSRYAMVYVVISYILFTGI